MKIKLTKDLAIDPIHGCNKDRVFEVTEEHAGRGRKVCFVGDNGERCCAFSDEYELVQE